MQVAYVRLIFEFLEHHSPASETKKKCPENFLWKAYSGVLFINTKIYIVTNWSRKNLRIEIPKMISLNQLI